jgi:hypothetical protein
MPRKYSPVVDSEIYVRQDCSLLVLVVDRVDGDAMLNTVVVRRILAMDLKLEQLKAG